MTDLDDARLEREIVDLLRRRDPGPAPIGLRERVARVPETAVVSPPLVRRLSRAVVPVLGLAAAVALAVLALPLLSPVGPGPGASIAPVTTFDPSLRGPGLVAPPAAEAEVLVALLLLVVGAVVVTLAPRGPRAVIAVGVLAVGGIGGAGVLMTHAISGPVASGGGGGRVGEEMSNGPRSTVFVTAAAGQPFSIGFSVGNDGPLPIRLEGLVADPVVQDGLVLYPTLRALWVDGATDGGATGMTGPARPFAPIGLEPGQFAVLWLVGTASPCAASPLFDPDTPFDTGMVGMPDLRVEYTVLGIPRTTTLRLPFDLMQPYAASCPAAQP